MDIKNDFINVQESCGKGLGVFAKGLIKEGQKIISEPPSVIGPKQTSPFVCIDCLDYINEQTGNWYNHKLHLLFVSIVGITSNEQTGNWYFRILYVEKSYLEK